MLTKVVKRPSGIGYYTSVHGSVILDVELAQYHTKVVDKCTFLQINLLNCKFFGSTGVLEHRLSKLSTNQNGQYSQATLHCGCSKSLESCGPEKLFSNKSAKQNKLGLKCPLNCSVKKMHKQSLVTALQSLTGKVQVFYRDIPL